MDWDAKASREARETAAKKQLKESSSKDQPGGMAPQGKSSGFSGQRTSGTKRASRPQGSDVTYYGCGKKGHIRKDRPHQKGEAKAVGSDGEDRLMDKELTKEGNGERGGPPTPSSSGAGCGHSSGEGSQLPAWCKAKDVIIGATSLYEINRLIDDCERGDESQEPAVA